MKKKYIALATLLALTIPHSSSCLWAGGGRTSFKVAPAPSHQEIFITNVTADAITVETRTVSAKGKIEEKQGRSFGVTKFTEIIVNGRKGTIADLKRGMRVHVTAGTDRTFAARIDANG